MLNTCSGNVRKISLSNRNFKKYTKKWDTTCSLSDLCHHASEECRCPTWHNMFRTKKSRHSSNVVKDQITPNIYPYFKLPSIATSYPHSLSSTRLPLPQLVVTSTTQLSTPIVLPASPITPPILVFHHLSLLHQTPSSTWEESSNLCLSFHLLYLFGKLNFISKHAVSQSTKRVRSYYDSNNHVWNQSTSTTES